MMTTNQKARVADAIQRVLDELGFWDTSEESATSFSLQVAMEQSGVIATVNQGDASGSALDHAREDNSYRSFELLRMKTELEMGVFKTVLERGGNTKEATKAVEAYRKVRDSKSSSDEE